ncbi:MAG: ribbon-helix-helix domain-containing protein [Alphaproteobacteria bacterium]|nr:ribbon-helix-helix domain-containing protein [Alphaproteobacteria bacterium]
MSTEPPITKLKSRSICVRGHRTSVRCDDETWSALQEISKDEKIHIHDICTEIADNKPTVLSLTAALRIFVLSYYRNQCNRLSDGEHRLPN